MIIGIVFAAVGLKTGPAWDHCHLLAAPMEATL